MTTKFKSAPRAVVLTTEQKDSFVVCQHIDLRGWRQKFIYRSENIEPNCSIFCSECARVYEIEVLDR